MLFNNRVTAGGRYKPSAPTAQNYNMPASVGGINALSAVSQMPATDCLYCYNLVPSEYGLRLRKGYKTRNKIDSVWPIATIIPFEGSVDNGSDDRLFAVSLEGIWDITEEGGTVLAPVVVFDDQTPPASFGTYTEFTNDAGRRYLMYADNANGIFYYNENSDPTPIFEWDAVRPVYTDQTDPVPPQTAPAATDIAFVTTWKNRVWLVPKESSTAFYLEPGAVSGEVTPFVFGGKFAHGGNLKGLYNWTVDGGDGVDDMLVAIGSAGDVLVYRGSGPEAISGDVEPFQLVGSYYVGGFPKSRNVAAQYGGELYLLSTYGVISVRQLLEGVMYEDPSQGPSAKINRFLRDALMEGKDSYVWRMEIYPSDGFLQIIAPYNYGSRADALQYNQNLMTQAWGIWRDVPSVSAATWLDKYIIGSTSGAILEYVDGLDAAPGTYQADPEGVGIKYEVLTSYQAPGGDETTFKRVGFIRPIQITQFAVNAVVRAAYDYELSPELPTPNNPITRRLEGARWGEDGETVVDEGIWDQSTWAGTVLGTFSNVRGSLGQGRTIAIAMQGVSNYRVTFVGWDVNWQNGGFL